MMLAAILAGRYSNVTGIDWRIRAAWHGRIGGEQGALMQRWQRRVHLWVWLALAVGVAALLFKMSDNEPERTVIEIPEQE